MNVPDELVSVRYMVDDVEAAIDFYTRHFGFTLRMSAAPAFAACWAIPLNASASPAGGAPTFFASPGGEQDDRRFPRRWIGAERTQQFETIQSRHHDISQQQIGRGAPHTGKRRQTVGHDLNIRVRAK